MVVWFGVLFAAFFVVVQKEFFIGASNQLRCSGCMKLIVEQPDRIADAVQFASTTFFCAISLQSASSCFEMSEGCGWQ